MRKAIFVAVGESTWISGGLRKLRSELVGQIEIVQPDTTVSANDGVAEWLIKKAAKVDFCECLTNIFRYQGHAQKPQALFFRALPSIPLAPAGLLPIHGCVVA